MAEVDNRLISPSHLKPNKRSCTRCNQRKVRCDKVYPCSACVKSEVQCSFPGSQRVRRTLNRPPIRELLTRLRTLEEEVEQLRSTRPNLHGDQTSDLDDHLNREHQTGNKAELLVHKKGKSRYVGDEASIALGQKVGYGCCCIACMN